MDIREMINQLRSGASDRQISRDMEIDRRTVKRYREWAQEQGLLAGDPPRLEEIQKLAAEPLVKRLGVSVIVTDDLATYRTIAEQLD